MPRELLTVRCDSAPRNHQKKRKEKKSVGSCRGRAPCRDATMRAPRPGVEELTRARPRDADGRGAINKPTRRPGSWSWGPRRQPALQPSIRAADQPKQNRGRGARSSRRGHEETQRPRRRSGGDTGPESAARDAAREAWAASAGAAGAGEGGGEVPRGEAAAVGAVRGRDPRPEQEDPDLARHLRLPPGRRARLRLRRQEPPRRRSPHQLPLSLLRNSALAPSCPGDRRGGGHLQPQQHRRDLERRRRRHRIPRPLRRDRRCTGRRGGLPQLLRLLLLRAVRGRRLRLRFRGALPAAAAVRSEPAVPGVRRRRDGLELSRHPASPLGLHPCRYLAVALTPYSFTSTRANAANSALPCCCSCCSGYF